MNVSKLGAMTAAMAILVSMATTARAEDFAQKHPRRAEVLHRDNNINNRINKNEGKLHGQYNQLKAEDQGIRHQEQADARANGGHITRGEKHQLNKEENQLNKQITQDKHQ